ncbi:carboxylate-amine ligase [Pseudomonas mediterranea]|uniref:carboxylate-amine ligase n=1 Tax=Pseudomonas mediterranea TaxID=183795 RepID=UPI0006D8B25D|nr:carboxylate-amine ligase [Pseudomonas mediterranea]MBL0841487.1 carboxylate-amine ligase [Pseudomonas mediterranea]QHA82693.1 carboxylate-amine ligase [Pseudomonas mediterranea]CAH0124387.1 Putative glutamate--cysteine ligase 2 [Pseudomonas mediterranea]
MNRRLKFGIEEEYFITDLQTRCMPGQPSEAAVAECRIELGKHFAHEMFQSQVEVASPIFRSLPEAADYLSEVRTGLTRRLAPHGLGLLSAGSHPMATQVLQPTDELHFQQLFDDYQRVARRSVLSGLHVHVEVPADRDRVRVMNEVLPWLPMFLALSASSPFWNGAYSGFSSYRQVACDEWPRMGVPEFFEDESAFAEYVDLLMRTGSIRQASDCWWVIRPSSHFPTLELRICDACPRIDDVLCLVSLFRLMVAHAIAQPKPGARYSQTSQWILKENRWRAKRHGILAEFIIEGQEQPMLIGEWLTLAEQTFGETAAALGVSDVFKQARRIVQEGTSADRQVVLYEQGLLLGDTPVQALGRVVDQLVSETAGLPVAGPTLQQAAGGR